MRKLIIAILLSGISLYAQNFRVGPIPFPSVSASNPPYLVANISPNLPVLAVCAFPANAVPCSNYATTYRGTGAPCPNGAQDTPDPNAGTSACQSTGDVQGNIGFWIPAGKYDYTVCIQTTCLGPYTVTVSSGTTGSTYVISVNGTVLTAGDTVNFNTSTPSAPTNGINVTWNKSTASITDSVSAAVVGDGVSTDCLLGTGVFSACPSVGFPSAPQVGDIIRYNVNGDSKWDAVNQAQAVQGIYAVNQTAPFYTFGPCSSGGATVTPTTNGGTSTVNPTAILNAGSTVTSASTASTSTVIGFSQCQNGNVSLLGMTAFYRLSTRMSISSTTNARYWLGLACFNGSGVGNNPTAIVGTTAYASDSPNKTTIGFRYSSTTDTHWQAVTAIAGGSQTTTDTGITPDTNPHLFEITTNLAGTSLFYFIDGSLVATISTNIPSAASGGNSWGSLFMTGDNKNTANVVAFTFYSMQISLRI